MVVLENYLNDVFVFVCASECKYPPTPEEGVVSLDPVLNAIGSCLIMGVLRT